jgi:hypothetical protein
MHDIPALNTSMIILLYLHPLLLSIFLSPCQTSVPAVTDREPPILKETENKQAGDIKVDKEESTNCAFVIWMLVKNQARPYNFLNLCIKDCSVHITNKSK